MCGIFGWTGVNVKSFNSIKFNILGNYNDSRGGDSCGVYYDETCIKGIDKESKYKDLVYSKELHTKLKLKNPLIIGHTRKASVGGVSITNIQPVILENKDSEMLYVQAHNGTISNYEELAEKYKIKIDAKESDSMVLAKLIYKEGFKVLREYEGSAALLIHSIS